MTLCFHGDEDRSSACLPEALDSIHTMLHYTVLVAGKENESNGDRTAQSVVGRLNFFSWLPITYIAYRKIESINASLQYSP